MRLFILQLGLLQPLGVPVPGYLVQTGDGVNVLVDTGMPHDYIADPPPPQAPFGFEVDMKADDFVVARLAAIGLRPEDIDVLVCTHFDEDHAGNHELFAHAELVVQERHYDLARSGHPRFATVRSHWDDPRLRYRLLDGDATLFPGLELIETSGHVPGHQSLLVELPETGPVVLAIDAVPAAAYFDPERPALPLDEDEEATRASTRKLAELAERRGARLVVFGHDADQWPTLRLSPDHYA